MNNILFIKTTNARLIRVDSIISINRNSNARLFTITCTDGHSYDISYTGSDTKITDLHVALNNVIKANGVFVDLFVPVKV